MTDVQQIHSHMYLIAKIRNNLNVQKWGKGKYLNNFVYYVIFSRYEKCLD